MTSRIPLRTAIFCYPWDISDEGLSVVLDNVQRRGGLGGIHLAVSYHSGMFLLPHNPRRKVLFPHPALYFRPDPARFAGLKIEPVVDEWAHTDHLSALRRETARRGLSLNAWTVCCHNSTLGGRHSECTQVNVFGDHIMPHLCPTHPDVRAYVHAMLTDLLARDFDTVLVESLEFMPFEHGYHHEVSGVSFTPLTAWWMGLCFCHACRQGAAEAGIDVQALQVFVRSELERFFNGDEVAGRPGITWPEIRALAGGELGAFHEFRQAVVTSLYQEVGAEREPGSTTRFEVIDFGPLWPLGPDGYAWESGFDLHAAAPYVDGLHSCAYFTDADQLRQAMDTYRALAPAELPLLPIIRAIPPQVTSAQDLHASVLACDPKSVAGMSFYNYGFMRYTTLDWIKAALGTTTRTARLEEP